MSVFLVAAAAAGERLDRYLARCLASVSRAQLHRWITAGRVRVAGAPRKPAYPVRAGERIEVEPPEPTALDVEPEPLPLDILYEDAEVIVVNKPAGMVVHPGAGQPRGTLVNALLAHCRDLAGIGDRLRPGIVHRLDKGTSGAIVVAKTGAAHRALVRQFQDRTVEKIYVAVVLGRLAATGRFDAAIGRHPRERKRMSTAARRGRAAVTEWRVAEAFGREAACVEVRLHTGRTHQIRVHFAAAGHPLIGDEAYGGGRGLRRLPAAWRERLTAFGRPALHAWRLAFRHPTSGAVVRLEAPPPADLLWLLQACRALVACG